MGGRKGRVEGKGGGGGWRGEVREHGGGRRGRDREAAEAGEPVFYDLSSWVT